MMSPRVFCSLLLIAVSFLVFDSSAFVPSNRSVREAAARSTTPLMGLLDGDQERKKLTRDSEPEEFFATWVESSVVVVKIIPSRARKDRTIIGSRKPSSDMRRNDALHLTTHLCHVCDMLGIKTNHIFEIRSARWHFWCLRDHMARTSKSPAFS